jgi:uncharacterized RDD family membrane protein YckC
MNAPAVVPSDHPRIDPAPTLPPVAGFWRRFAAWFVDITVVGVIGQALVSPIVPLWFRVGPYGRFVGLAILVAYFGLLGSRLSNGQTLGKRLLGISVRGADGEPTTVGRALVRAAILAVPYILNQWTFPGSQTFVAQWLGGVVVFGVGGAIVYTMIFNRRARQGLHDLICNTYVVRRGGEPVASLPATARVHRVLAAAIVAAVAVATAAALITLEARMQDAPMTRILRAVSAGGDFFSVGINDSTVYGGQAAPQHVLQVQVWSKGQTSDAQEREIMNGLARVVLQSGEDVDRYDLLRFGVMKGCDLGIASSFFNHQDAEPPAVWRHRVGASAPR